MIDLKELSAEELLRLSRAVAAEDERRQAEEIKPLPKDQIELDKVIRICEGLHEEELEGPEAELDHQYTYESLMGVVYGPDYFDRLRKIQENTHGN